MSGTVRRHALQDLFLMVKAKLLKPQFPANNRLPQEKTDETCATGD